MAETLEVRRGRPVDATANRSTTTLGRQAVVSAAVFASFLGYSLVQAPIPAPNEPHYLCKAKHYWDRDYCPDDLFLESSYAHAVFYWTVGPLTLFLSLEQTAWAARLIGYALLAVGWTSLISRLAASPWAALWACWVFLALATFGNLSGEWIVGGIEAKIFSYAFVFLALAQLLDRRWSAAGIYGGLGVSVHPVVGLWAVIAAALAMAARMAEIRCLRLYLAPGDSPGAKLGPDAYPTPPTSAEENTLHRRESAALERFSKPGAAILLAAVCSLPGLIPAVMLLVENDHPRADEANRIQVFQRLGHHLDPTKFRKTEWLGYEIEAAWLGYACLLLFWLGIRSRTLRDGKERWFCRFVLGTVVIALAGLAVGLVPRLPDGSPDADSALFNLRVSLMKFYPFRLCDVFLPIAAAVTFIRLVEHPKPTGRIPWDPWDPAIYSGFLVFALLWPIPDRNPSHMQPKQLADWQSTCRWIERNTPADAHFLTPRASWAFKWYAQRAEYDSYKDCPQDAAGILEWQRRRRFIAEWGERHYGTDPVGYSGESLRELHRKEGITHILCHKDVPMAIDPVYPTGSHTKSRYRVYRLEDAFEQR